MDDINNILTQQVYYTTEAKVQRSIERLKAFEPKDGYYVAFSGGKDSQCIYHLCEMAGVKFDAHYRITTVDPPELVRFIKSHYPNVSMEHAHYADGTPITMWNLIPNKTVLPTRQCRYCCASLKQAGGKGRITVTGVRWAQSKNRKELHGVVGVRGKKAIEIAKMNGSNIKLNKHNDDNDQERRTVQQCFRTRKTILNPIVDWQDVDVWKFLNDIAKVQHCQLYDKGFKRIGCIGCPLAGSKRMREQFAMYPKYKQLYMKAMERMIKRRKQLGIDRENNRYDWSTPKKIFDWWLDQKHELIDGQIDIDELMQSEAVDE